MNNHSPVDFARARAADYRFALVRATQGVITSRPVGADKKFVEFADGALAAGLALGVYHAFLGGSSGQAQAEFFLGAITSYLSRLSFAPIIDCEETPSLKGHSDDEIADNIYELARALESALRLKPMIYTSAGFWRSRIGTRHADYFATLDLHVAHYTSAPVPLVPKPWTSWLIWQDADNGSVPGVPGAVDTDRVAR